MYKLPTVYLAGAIRNHHQEDIRWRERFIDALGEKAVLLNPLAGKTFDKETEEWFSCGIVPDGPYIVHHDFWAIDHSDIVVFNLTCLSDGYPTIGSLIEFGRCTTRGCLIYSIVKSGYTGHNNVGLYNLHPFIKENSAVVFPTDHECLAFLKRKLSVLSGMDSHFKGAM